jgi:hypothetical protein
MDQRAGLARVGTGQYVKVCAEHLAEVEQWASDHVGEPIPCCRTCRPARQAGRPVSATRTPGPAAGPVPGGHSKIRGPVADNAVVEVWADRYIRFERRHRPVWQQHLVAEIKARCGQLEPSVGQILHATFFGAKRPEADVENVVLYYIDSFAAAGRNGIRFGHGGVVPPAPDGSEYPFCYSYALAPQSGGFGDWRQGRTLALFDWTDLGAFDGEKLAAQVWVALRRGEVEVFEPACAPETHFAVKVQIRPPHRHRRGVGNLVKGIFDGVISAFQVHDNPVVLPEVGARLATLLRADHVQIEEYLLDERRAVLGRAPRLVHPYRKGVQWNPTDHLCVAGELLLAEPVGSRWAIRGEIVELSR